MGGGLFLVAVGLFLMHGVEVGDDWTGLLPGFIVAGIGVGHDQPDDRRDGDRRRAGGAGGDGVGDQLARSARSASRRASRRSAPSSPRASARSSRPSSPAQPAGDSRPRGPVLRRGLLGRRSIRRSRTRPSRPRDCPANAADASFITAFNEILLIACGRRARRRRVLGFLMVRKRDFVGWAPERSRAAGARAPLRSPSPPAKRRARRGESVPARRYIRGRAARAADREPAPDRARRAAPRARA